MINTKKFGEKLINNGYNFFAGVPCSYQKNLINFAINESEFIMSSNEGDAVSTCSGAFYAGKKPVVLMQNSGLGNAVSPLSSLNYNYKIPILGFVSLRGEVGKIDEPQHELMGEITCDLLDLMKIKWAFLEKDTKLACEQIKIANSSLETGNSFFFIVRKETFSNHGLKVKSVNTSINSRADVIKSIISCKKKSTMLLGTTGKTGRELFQIGDSRENFYMTGSMGCLSSFALGLAKNTSKNIIAIDGDGSVLMRMGNLSTIGYYKPNNLLHLVLDNNCHDSTGGQFTTSSTTKFNEISKFCGYEKFFELNSLSDLEKIIVEWEKSPKLCLIHFKILPGSIKNLGRPNLSPEEMSLRFKRNF